MKTFGFALLLLLLFPLASLACSPADFEILSIKGHTEAGFFIIVGNL